MDCVFCIILLPVCMAFFLWCLWFLYAASSLVTRCLGWRLKLKRLRTTLLKVLQYPPSATLSASLASISSLTMLVVVLAWQALLWGWTVASLCTITQPAMGEAFIWRIYVWYGLAFQVCTCIGLAACTCVCSMYVLCVYCIHMYVCVESSMHDWSRCMHVSIRG